MTLVLVAVVFSLTLYPHFSSPIRPFRPLGGGAIPKSLANSLCAGPDLATRKECLEDFREHGLVWSGDVNGDGAKELIVFGGDAWAGSAGRNYELFSRHGDHWESLFRSCDSDEVCDASWLTKRLRTQILPIVRDGYRDLRIEVDHCIKWDGAAYVDYTPDDCHQLLPAWFNASGPNEAEIFWTIRYAGLDQFHFEPQWFPINPEEFRDFRDPGKHEGRSDGWG